MENLIYGTLGIIVSISLFLLSYRKTIGAKRERIQQANNEIEKILVRRIVLESYSPDTNNISRLIQGKARDFKVNINDLMSESQFLNTIFTRILETDFINPQQREDIFKKLYPIIEAAETQPIEEADVERIPSLKLQSIQKFVFTFITILIASLISGIIAYIPDINQLNSEFKIKDIQMSPSALFFVAITFILILFILVLKIFKESQEDTTNKKTSIQQYFEFEKEVLELLKKYSSVQSVAPPNKGYDFLILKQNKKILIEVKNWSKRIPASVIARVSDRLNKAVQSEKADEAIIVTKNISDFPFYVFNEKPIKIMTIKELKNYLIHK